MLRNYQNANHIITIHRAGMRDDEYTTILARVRYKQEANDFAIIETPSIAYVCFASEVKALRAMLDLHGLGTIGYTQYVSHRSTVQYNNCRLRDFFGVAELVPAPTS